MPLSIGYMNFTNALEVITISHEAQAVEIQLSFMSYSCFCMLRLINCRPPPRRRRRGEHGFKAWHKIVNAMFNKLNSFFIVY